MRQQNRLSGFGLERLAAAYHAVHHRAKAVQVRLVRDRQASGLFRAHEGRSTDHLRDSVHRGQIRVTGLRETGDTEVHDPGLKFPSPSLDHHNVGRLQVAVNDTLIVGVLERVAHLNDNPRGLVPAQTPGLRGDDLHMLLEVLTAQQFHDDEHATGLVLVHIVNSDRVPGLHSHQGAGLFQKLATRLRVFPHLVADHLDRDLGPRQLVRGTINLTETALADAFDKHIPAAQNGSRKIVTRAKWKKDAAVIRAACDSTGITSATQWTEQALNQSSRVVILDRLAGEVFQSGQPGQRLFKIFVTAGGVHVFAIHLQIPGITVTGSALSDRRRRCLKSSGG